ncbi:MAG: hypothetical protein ABR951_10630 [Candidatus Aminicenantales bacterium]
MKKTKPSESLDRKALEEERKKTIQRIADDEDDFIDDDGVVRGKETNLDGGIGKLAKVLKKIEEEDNEKKRD